LAGFLRLTSPAYVYVAPAGPKSGLVKYVERRSTMYMALKMNGDTLRVIGHPITGQHRSRQRRKKSKTMDIYVLDKRPNQSRGESRT
jgi:hypothetical protein